MNLTPLVCTFLNVVFSLGESESKFYYKVVEAQVTFVRDESGNVSSLILHQYGRDQVAKKVE